MRYAPLLCIGRGNIATTSALHGAARGNVTRASVAPVKTGWSNPQARQNLARNMAMVQARRSGQKRML
jgi:hypothetical protein